MATTAPLPALPALTPAVTGQCYTLDGPDRTVQVVVHGDRKATVYRADETTERDEQALELFLVDLGMDLIQSDEIVLLGVPGPQVRITHLSV